jgi:aminobenzoyl-glutamate utilization protein B
MRPILCLALPLLADDKSGRLQTMDARAAHYGEISRRIWEFAEPGFQESQGAGLLKSELRAAGFSLADNVAGMPAAFTAISRIPADQKPPLTYRDNQ